MRRKPVLLATMVLSCLALIMSCRSISCGPQRSSPRIAMLPVLRVKKSEGLGVRVVLRNESGRALRCLRADHGALQYTAIELLKNGNVLKPRASDGKADSDNTNVIEVQPGQDFELTFHLRKLYADLSAGRYDARVSFTQPTDPTVGLAAASARTRFIVEIVEG